MCIGALTVVILRLQYIFINILIFIIVVCFKICIGALNQALLLLCFETSSVYIIITRTITILLLPLK